MEIRADLSKLAYLTPDDWRWSQSPQAGVSRVMLDRDEFRSICRERRIPGAWSRAGRRIHRPRR